MSNKLSTKPYKGVRDFYPQDWMFQKWMFWKMSEVCERFGYENYNASPLEASELYEAKSGSEMINNETYNLVDRGDRRVTIRPEMTPTVARMVADRARELPKPIRWYSIPNLFRYERPQRGRLREHYQLNVDIFGSDSVEADVEVIHIGSEIMKNLGAQSSDFKIIINNRKIINSLLDIYSLFNAEKKYALSKLLDKKNKLPQDVFEKEARVLFDDDEFYSAFIGFTKLQQDVPLDTLDKDFFLTLKQEKLAGITRILEKVANNPTMYQKDISESDFLKKKDELLQLQAEGYDELTLLISGLQSQGVQNVYYRPILMRGFDYYTSTIFEFFDTHPDNNRSLFGGGRYNDLLDIFDMEKVPAVGFGMGDVTARDFLETHGLMPELLSHTTVYIGCLDQSSLRTAQEVASLLRENEINTELDFSYRKYDKLIKAADKKLVPYFIAIGENEVASGEYTVRNMKTGDEQKVPMDQIATIVSN